MCTCIYNALRFFFLSSAVKLLIHACNQFRGKVKITVKIETTKYQEVIAKGYWISKRKFKKKSNTEINKYKEKNIACKIYVKKYC